MPIGTFKINTVAIGVVFGWLFEKTKVSVLPVLLIHTSLNTSGGILVFPLERTGMTYLILTALLVAVALVILLVHPTRSVSVQEKEI